MIFNSQNSKLQSDILRERIEYGKFIYLRQFPNRSLLSKSKVLKLKSNSDYFDERCHILIQFIYLLLKIQIEKSSVYISKNIFINYSSQVFMFYTFDSQYSTKLTKIQHGNLLEQVIQFFKVLFTIEMAEILDYQKLLIYQNLNKILQCDFVDLNQREKKYYYQIFPKNNFEDKLKPYITSTVLAKFQNSKLFKEYNYLLKNKTAILIIALLQRQKQKLFQKYIQLIRSQSLIFQKLNKYSSKHQIQQYIKSYIRQIMQFLCLLQSENYIKIFDQKDSNGSKMNEEGTMEQLNFCSNLRRQIQVNLTNNQKSQESSVSNEQNNISQDKRNALRRSKQQYQEIYIKKNTINFSISIQFNHQKYEFQIIVQGISQWKIQQLYYCIFHDIWLEFINNHIFHQIESEQMNYKYSYLKMFIKDKNVGIRQRLSFSINSNIIQDIIVTYDKIIGYFLLFQNILKNIYLFSQHQAKFEENCIKKMHNSKLIQNLLIIYQQFIRKYEKYKKQLVNLTKYV